MIAEVARKELMLARRETLVLILGAVCAVLLAVATLAGMQREAEFARERAAAEHADRAVWMNQGDRNPHSAAHFSRYAFRPSAPLALMDPGISDFAGVAVWLEAHFQDPAEFRRAEDSGELARYVPISPASLFLIALPLLIFVALYASIAGEREDGTLRQLVASGAGVKTVYAGKFIAGLRLVLPVFAVVFVLTVAVSLAATPAPVGMDTVVRIIAMLLLFLAYLGCCIAIAIAVSACFRTRQGALLGLVCTWAVMTVIGPRLAADVGASLTPPLDARTVTRDLEAASYTYYNDEDRQEQIKQDLLHEYGVAAVEDLPIEYGAYTLQVSEELSFPEFDRVYASVAARHRAQNDIARLFAVLTPMIPAANLSRGIAGTDSIHQSDFVTAAESHRRDMIKLLNEDYMVNAGAAGYGYTADAGLWERFSDFDHPPLTLAQSWSAYLTDLVLLLAWLAFAVVAAYALVRRAFRAEGL